MAENQGLAEKRHYKDSEGTKRTSSPTHGRPKKEMMDGNFAAGGGVDRWTATGGHTERRKQQGKFLGQKSNAVPLVNNMRKEGKRSCDLHFILLTR